MEQTLRQNLRGLTSTEYDILRSMSHLSKNLYNRSLYLVRQHYFNNGEYQDYYDTYDIVKNNWNYEVLNSQMAQQTIKHVDRGLKSFLRLAEKKKEGKYNEHIDIPGYLPKDGYYQLTYPNQAFTVKDDHIRIGVPKQFREEFGYNQKEIQIPFTYDEVTEDNKKELQIIPKADAEYFEYRVVYEKEKQPVETEEDTVLAVDLGVDNFATCVDHSGRSWILCGRELKSLNRWYNREIARLQGIKDKQGIEHNTRKINRLV
ncbi:MAG: RNA-guided endonuclease InsQ/TnpB family protein [Halobacteria archaeon]